MMIRKEEVWKTVVVSCASGVTWAGVGWGESSLYKLVERLRSGL